MPRGAVDNVTPGRDGFATMSAMSTSPPRRSRAFRGDARFFIGILLVIASVIGVWFVVTSARQTVPVLAASRTIVAGESISAKELTVVEVALGAVGAVYLEPEGLTEGMIATRTIADGELVPASAVGEASASLTTTIVVRSAVDVPATVATGAVVELWSAPADDDGGFDVPRILIPDAVVVAVTRDESMMGGGSAMLELVIPRADVADALAAVAAGSALSVVPTGGGVAP